MKLLPQELEVWYLIPAIRRELTKFFIKKHELTQKQVAEILGLTESAVSQYLKGKRAEELKFNASEVKIIEKYADKIIKDKKSVGKHLFSLSIKLRGTSSLCELHKEQDSSVNKNCKICMEK